ncbi:MULTISPECIES: ATP synthase F1 subunit delta [unclassified Coleofasciculus]|uniref:ATP synthase F1 subunit delta n=1 Tax=unclassified Coleofasciculus TaxID=2692782 RepID=UPI00187EDA54|nr:MULTISPECIES: ATP synthase F1 subunit delta [unclassified Coleofasciculus]MBE9126827.1 F0F1 ATP synthase subunit delta [Coleofasciculus sp. LEGE 07081]MBE9148963.1 F0F1 ATP synthase subunit delta [Coleofasciculus sp. LEGE 07092]
MKGSLVSAEVIEPYAEALMSVGQEHNLVDRFGEDVAALLDLFRESPEFQEFIGNPIVKADDKKAVLQQIAGDQLHPYMVNFLKILVERRRILFLEGVCKQYQALLRKLKQTVLAEVTSAVELNDDQKQAVRQKVIAMTNAQQVELDTTIEPDLIGGVIVKVGSQVIDASLRGQLRRIGIRLNSAT